MIDSIDSILTVKDVAGYLRVNPRTVYRLAVDRKLPGFKVGTTWRFKRSDIDEWIRQQSVDGLEPGQVARDKKKSRPTKEGKK